MNKPGGLAADRLKSFVERIERLEAERKALAEDVKDVKAEARQAGFDVKTINKVIARRRMTAEARDEEDALLEIYEGALGMLEGTPLGEAARKRLSGRPPRRPPGDDVPDEHDDAPGVPPDGPDEDAGTPEAPAATVEEARELGREAALNGKPVTENPFPPADPRRAAWDEGWCEADGSDGMDIPEAWRRKKPKRGDGKPGGDGEPGGEAR
ncbi:DUF2312 domain-containing protein [Shumkonia mesophila]|uniref:DUF2312 domain-containing protein n=1 Tax=Shumkonia mesophila TaxID=2838854 RepID=UPI002934610D|nr:DUF2312 domain-containing protein [Shumkonia mesophila]